MLVVADRAVLRPAGQRVRMRHREEDGTAHLDVVIDIGQLQREAAAEVPLCTATGVARGQLRPVRLCVTIPVSAFWTDVALAGRGQPTSSQKQYGHRLRAAVVPMCGLIPSGSMYQAACNKAEDGRPVRSLAHRLIDVLLTPSGSPPTSIADSRTP